jgi:hypothetical protein
LGSEVVQLTRRRFGETMRRDAWWVQPAITFIVFASFIVYSTWAALQNAHYEFGSYLSPLYSPLLFADSPHAWIRGGRPSWLPGFLPFSPALFILPFPGLFRFTCYYYRGAYYKAFWADPPSCTIGEPRTSYWGERSFPLVMQNIHRYFLYLGLLFIVILTYDAIMSFRFPDGFGIGVGSLVLTGNTILLACYTFSCHSLRHIIGGRKDEIAGSPLQSGCYSCVSALNRKHHVFAWLSLCSVAFADLYVRLCSMGVWTDLRLL